MKFLIDAMFPAQMAERLNTARHDAVTPAQLGADNLPDEVLIQRASAEQGVIVTENAADFPDVNTGVVVFVPKWWWPPKALAPRLAKALDPGRRRTLIPAHGGTGWKPSCAEVYGIIKCMATEPDSGCSLGDAKPGPTAMVPRFPHG